LLTIGPVSRTSATSPLWTGTRSNRSTSCAPGFHASRFRLLGSSAGLTMSEPSSPSSPTPSAFFDPDSSSWKTSQLSLASLMGVEEDLTLLERLPDWVMWDGQALFALRTPERLTAARDGSASLPTPRAQNGEPRNMKPWVRPLDQPQNLENAIARLLPTPQHWDHKVFGPNVDWKKRAESHAESVASVIMNLPLNDGNESSDDEHLTQLTIEDCDPPSSPG